MHLCNFVFLLFSFLVHSVSEAVRNQVTKKLERAKVIPTSVVAQAAQTASELTSKKYVAQALSDIICRQIPEELKKSGIEAKMEEVFRENTFVVLQLQLLHVDPLTLASEWTEAGISWVLESIGAQNRRTFEEKYLPKVLVGILATIIPRMLGDEMSDKKIDAETKVNKPSEQSLYFFETLNKLRTNHLDEKRINRNPINKLRKRISSQSSLGNNSTRSLNSLYSVDAEDELTVDTRGSKGSSRSRGSRGSKSTTKKNVI